MKQTREPTAPAPPASIDVNRRGFLTRLAALPAALGLAAFVAGAADAEGKKKNRKTSKRGGKNARKGNGGGGKKKNDGDGKGKGNAGGSGLDSEERRFLDLINDYRRQNGAGALSLHSALNAAAADHSRDMAQRNFFRHSNTRQLVERHGYRGWKAIGENIAAGDETAAQVFQSWKQSNTHARNMRSKDFTEIGIGRASSKGSKYGWYWTTTFGDR